MKDSLNFYHPTERPWPNPLLTRTSIVGHTTPTTVRLWFRVSSPGDYCLVVAKNPLPTDGVPVIHTISEDSETLFFATADNTEEISIIKLCHLTFDCQQDLIQVVDLVSLEPNCRYYYGLFKDNGENSWSWELGHDDILSFQTFPDRATSELTFGIYSCHMPYKEKKLVNMELWESFDRELCDGEARFIIGMGDQVYVDGNDHFNIWDWLKKVKHKKPAIDDMLSWYRDIYRGYWGMPELQRVLGRFPSYMIWDDHEIFDGWGSYTEAELSAQVSNSWRLENPKENIRLAGEMFQAATQVYQEYQHSHNPPGDETAENPLNQFDYSFNYGDYAFYVLDMRGHRDLNREEFRVLGLQQWHRFEAWVKAQYRLNSQILFVVSPGPVVHLDNLVVNILDIPYLRDTDDLRDHWEHRYHWKERNHVLEVLFKFSQTTKRPVIFLSGDVHLGATFELSHPSFPEAKVFQLTSTPITYTKLTDIKRAILANMVKEEGELGDEYGNIAYQFKNLHVCDQNNFGLVRVNSTETGEVSVTFDLFSKTQEENATIEKNSIKLF